MDCRWSWSRGKNCRTRLEQGTERFGNLVELRLGDLVEKGQRDGACGGAFGDGQRSTFRGAIRRLKMDGSEVAATGDAARGHLFDDSIAAGL